MKEGAFFLLFIATIAVSASGIGSSAAASPLPANEYIPYHPTGCRYLRKRSDGRFAFVQSCSRGTNGEWEQVVEAMELATPGVIYIPRQILVNGSEVEGFWCSGAAPRAFKEPFQDCAKSGCLKRAAPFD